MAELVSTRDPNRETFSYPHAVREGLAPDGGLYVLNKCPQFGLDELQALQDQPFDIISTAVQARLIDGDVPWDDLRAMTGRAYAANKFPGTAGGNIVPVKEIGNKLWMEQLYKGPTGAFKDIPLRFIAQVLPYALNMVDYDQVFRMVGASSGDTVSAAEDPFKGVAGFEQYLITPEKGMTEFQIGQMAKLSGGNIHNLRIPGSFDDAQRMVKEIKKDPEFADMGAVNSINVGRIFAQVAYVVAGYLQLMQRTGQEIGQPIDVSIPTGNFGNAYSVYLAKMMGVPIRNIIIATNENDLVDRLVRKGEYVATKRIITSSPSMDVSSGASNFERLLWHMVDGDSDKVRQYMGQFERDGKVSLSSIGLDKAAFAQLGITSGSSNHQDRLGTIRQVYADSQSVIDPHTADAVTVARRQVDDEIPRLVLGTADQVKFEPITKEALGFVAARDERFEGMERHIQPDSFTTIAVSVEALKSYIRVHTARKRALGRVATA